MLSGLNLTNGNRIVGCTVSPCAEHTVVLQHLWAAFLPIKTAGIFANVQCKINKSGVSYGGRVTNVQTCLKDAETLDVGSFANRRRKPKMDPA